MNRKHFLSALGLFAIARPGLSNSAVPTVADTVVLPPYLKPGDQLGVTSPAGYITLADIQPAIKQIEQWGLVVKTGSTIGQRDFSFGGTDTERVADFQQMLDDRAIKAIMCARGGYGFIRIIDRLDFTGFLRSPKWIIGFSDVTVLHCHLAHNYGVASIHSKMCNSFPDDWSKADPVQADTILSIRNALMGTRPMSYAAMPDPMNRGGSASGVLVGGNLKTIETLSGTKSSLRAQGKILFVEDTGEYLYSIDRMFWNLKRTGQLSDLKGLIIGGFKVKPDDPGEEFGRTVQEIVLEKVSGYNYPVCFNFPVGHQRNNYALKCGVPHKLVVTSDGSTLREVA